MAAFSPGDRVAWDHQLATQHAAGSIIRIDAAGGEFGVVKEVANEEGTWFLVEFDEGEKVLTADELVRVGE
jgi:hypothetical protein